nr:unnamed protein product [Callosobruchus analis]
MPRKLLKMSAIPATQGI